jgi:hypothetical protein
MHHTKKEKPPPGGFSFLWRGLTSLNYRQAANNTSAHHQCA